jgi:hypothetical protein
MPTKIFFANGETVTVSDEPSAVAQKLGAGGLAELERPWGDEAIYVNIASVNYIEAEAERAPDIEALEAQANSPSPGAPAGASPTGGAPGGPAPGTPGGPPIQPPPR